MAMTTRLSRKVLASFALLLAAPAARGDTLVVESGDPVVWVGGYGGGRFRGTLNGVPVYLYCIDFNHTFSYNVSYTVDVTPLYGNVTGETRHGAVPLDGWNYANNQYTALQRYMMASWLVTQYAPYFANWSSSSSQSQAKGIQSAIWALLDPAGWPYPPSAGNRDDWLTAAQNIITQPDYDEATDPFYRYFRIVTPATNTAPVPQEFIVVVTPEPASVLLLGGVLALLGLGTQAGRRLRAKRGNA